MKTTNRLFTKLLLTSLLLLGSPVNALATDMRISNFYPSVFGEYQNLRLLKRSVDLSGTCQIGTIYINSSDQLLECSANGLGAGYWRPIPDIWTQDPDTDYIYLTDTSNPSLQVGIGTATPEFKLTLNTDGGILAKGTFGSGDTLPDLGAGTRMLWYPRKAAFRAGYVSGSQWDDSSIGNYSMAMGRNTVASGVASVVVGGDGNTASGDYTAIIGGQSNTASARGAVVGGGQNNVASAQYSAIGGGFTNTASANAATVFGGANNQATAIGATVGGGTQNSTSVNYSFIGGGYLNNLSDAVVDGMDWYSTIGGGRQNISIDDYTTIGGGYNNYINGEFNTIAGGLNQFTQGVTIPPNTYIPSFGTVLGGSASYIRGRGSYGVTGGFINSVDARYGVSLGGDSNGVGTEDGGWNFDNEGSVNVGGQTNIIGKQYSVTTGGFSNYVWGNYSWAAGRGMWMGQPGGGDDADRSFLWGSHNTGITPTIKTDDAFMIYSGKMGIRDINPAAVLEINTNGVVNDYLGIGSVANGDKFYIKYDATPTIKAKLGVGTSNPANSWDFANASGAYLSTGGTWFNGSSRKMKTNITPLTEEESLTALNQLRPVTFNYQATNNPGVGFIAEEVPEIVAMNDRKSISSMDVIALLIEAAKSQEKQIRNDEQQLLEMEKQVETLTERLNQLKAR